MAGELQGKTIALLIAQRGTEESEFTRPRQALQDAGAAVDVISDEAGEVDTVNHDLDPGGTYSVDKPFTEVSPADYDAVVVPGGAVGADTLRGDADAVAFIRGFFDAGKPAAVICHGPWTLVEADVVDGRRLTSYPTLQTDVRNAGGDWVDEEVVTDQGLTTSRNPGDLDAFCARIVEEFATARQTAGAASS